MAQVASENEEALEAWNGVLFDRWQAGAEAAGLRPKLATLLRKALVDFDTGDGVIAGSSTWIVTATVPA